MWVESGFGEIVLMFRFVWMYSCKTRQSFHYNLYVCSKRAQWFIHSNCSQCDNLTCTCSVLDIISHFATTKPKNIMNQYHTNVFVSVRDIEQMWYFCIFFLCYHWFVWIDCCTIDWRIDEYTIKPVARKDQYCFLSLIDSYFNSIEKNDSAPIPFPQPQIRLSATYIHEPVYLCVCCIV